MPFVAKRSFAPHGMPCSGPLYRPARISRSAAAACVSASVSVSVTTQFSFGPYFFSRARYMFVSSVAETMRRSRSGARAVIGRNARSSSDCGLMASADDVIRMLPWRGMPGWPVARQVRTKADRRFGVERDRQISKPLERIEIAAHAGGCRFLLRVREVDAHDLLGAVECGLADPRSLLLRGARGQARTQGGRDRGKKTTAGDCAERRDTFRLHGH